MASSPDSTAPIQGDLPRAVSSALCDRTSTSPCDKQPAAEKAAKSHDSTNNFLVLTPEPKSADSSTSRYRMVRQVQNNAPPTSQSDQNKFLVLTPEPTADAASYLDLEYSTTQIASLDGSSSNTATASAPCPTPLANADAPSATLDDKTQYNLAIPAASNDSPVLGTTRPVAPLPGWCSFRDSSQSSNSFHTPQRPSSLSMSPRMPQATVESTSVPPPPPTASVPPLPPPITSSPVHSRAAPDGFSYIVVPDLMSVPVGSDKEVAKLCLVGGWASFMNMSRKGDAEKLRKMGIQVFGEEEFDEAMKWAMEIGK